MKSCVKLTFFMLLYLLYSVSVFIWHGMQLGKKAKSYNVVTLWLHCISRHFQVILGI